jgi:hypothetical protein
MEKIELVRKVYRDFPPDPTCRERLERIRERFSA